MLMHLMGEFSTLAIREMISKLSSEEPSSSRKFYRATERGKVDLEAVYTAVVLKEHWTKHPGEPITYAAIQRQLNHGLKSENEERRLLPQAIVKMARLRLIRLLDKGAVVAQGEEWGETTLLPTS